MPPSWTASIYYHVPNILSSTKLKVFQLFSNLFWTPKTQPLQTYRRGDPLRSPLQRYNVGGGALDAPRWISHRSIDPNVGADIIRPPISQCQMGPITYIYVLCENHFDFHRADNIRPYVQISNNVKRRAQGPPLHYIFFEWTKKKTATFRLRSLCWRYLSSRVGQVLSWRRNSPVDCCSQNWSKIRKESSLSLTLLCVGVTYLPG